MFYTGAVGILVGNGGLSRLLFLVYSPIPSYTDFWAAIASYLGFMPHTGSIDYIVRAARVKLRCAEHQISWSFKVVL
jgi:hypothetical protein